MIAALYVMADGPYAGLPDVDPWPESRDARVYAGPHPVVAHPPCQRWGSFAGLNYARWGGAHNRPGNDGGCFLAAIASVRRWGGVLEHPRASRAWRAHGVATPPGVGWVSIAPREWTCIVWQSAYGHRAAKATRLLYVGDERPAELRWDRPKGSHQVGFHDRRGKEANKPHLSRREAAETPAAFRDALLGLARAAGLTSPT